MSLNRYYVDASCLSVEDRVALSKRIEQRAFTFAVHLGRVGCYDVYWDGTHDLREVLEIPDSCEVTLLA